MQDVKASQYFIFFPRFTMETEKENTTQTAEEMTDR